MNKKDKSLLNYFFLLGLSDKYIEQIKLYDESNIQMNQLPKVLSFYSNEGNTNLFKSIKENLESNIDLLNNIFPMKSDYLDIISSDEYDEKIVKNLKDVFIDYIIRTEDNKCPNHIYHCFQYELDRGTVHDLILNFGVLIFYENIIKNENSKIKNKNIFVGKALILISYKPNFTLMRKILDKIYIDFISQKFSPFYLEPFIINCINSLNTNLSSILFQNEEKIISITYKTSQEQIIPFCDLNIGYFFEIFDINDIYLIAEYYFLNKSIIISSPNVEILYPIYHILMTLFYPLNFHLRSYFYKLLYPQLVVDGLCSPLPCFYFIYTDITKENGFINEKIIRRITEEKKEVLIYQINKIFDKGKYKHKFEIKKNIYLFDEKEKFHIINTENKKEKTLIENIITNQFVYKSMINSEFIRIKKLVENINTDFFDFPIDIKEYDLLRKNFLGMIIKFLVIKIKPLTFIINEEEKMEMCPLKMKSDVIDEEYEDFLNSPQTEIIYKNSAIKFNELNIDYLKTQMLLDNFIKISKSDPNTLYFDDNINNNGKENNYTKNIEFNEIFNYKNFINAKFGEIKEEKNEGRIIKFEELKKYIEYNEEKIKNIFGNEINLILFYNENFFLDFEKFNKAFNNSINIFNEQTFFVNINDIITDNNQQNLEYYYLILYEAHTFKKLFYTINTKSKEELSACYIGLYISLYILNLLSKKSGTKENDKILINNINTLFEKLFTLFTKTKCFYGKYNFITTLIYLILTSYNPLKLEYKERFIYSLEKLKDVPSIIIFLLYNNDIEFNLCSANDNLPYKEQKIFFLKRKIHEHQFELEKISSNFVCVDDNCQEYMWYDIVNSEKDEKICENALNPICKIEDILEKIEEKNSLILPDIYNFDYLYQVCILDDIYFDIRFFRDDYLDELEY